MQKVDSQRNRSSIEHAIDATVGLMPEALQKLASELEILTGRRAKKRLPTKATLKTIECKLRRMAKIVGELDMLGNAPSTPESAAKVYQLLNSLLRLMVPRIPKDREPVDHVIQEIQRLTKMPTFDLPPGLDYKTKHLGLQNLVYDVVSSVNPAELDAFLGAGFTERHLVSQYQRSYSKMMLPKELKRYPRRMSRQWVERLKLALRDVTADWEALLTQLYGLILMKRGEHPTWVGIRKTSLWDKVIAVRNEQQLVSVAKQEWVTVRNSLAHARAFSNPIRESIEFPDRTRTVSWSSEQAFLEGIDICLANLAMMGTWNFVHLARLQPFEAQMVTLKQCIGTSKNVKTV